MELLADYLLYWLNKEQNFSYVDYFGLEEPIDNISELLFKIALKSGSSRKIRLATGKLIMPGKTFPKRFAFQDNIQCRDPTFWELRSPS